jgi:amino acid transporter
MICRVAHWLKTQEPIVGVTAVAAVMVCFAFVLDLFVELDYRLAANISLLCVALLVNVFTLLYLFRSIWWKNEIGKIYLAKCLVLSAVLDQIALSLWWDLDYPFRQQIRFAIYTLGAVAYLPMLVSLLREQSRDRRRVRA